MTQLTAIRKYVRLILQEEIGRNWRSIETMPIDYKRYPELSVSVDYVSEKGKWMAGIKPKDASKKVYRYFNSQEDAEMWARTEAERLRSKLFAKKR